MKARYLNEFVDGSRVDSVFMLRSKEVRTARTGDGYLAVDLSDRSGAMSAVYFRPSRQAMDIPSGSVVQITGTVTSYRGVRRISIEAMSVAEDWDPNDLMATGRRAVEELVSDFRRVAGSVHHPGLKSLLRTVFADKDFFTTFCRCPGSQSYHHSYVGGLLEHTVSVADHCAMVAPKYEGVSADLLISAALLHDIGKVDELSWDCGIGYTDKGRFIGHVVLGLQRVESAAVKTRIDADVLARLEHAILSHHGELEWGSPKRPSTLEALLLHHIDNLDAKVTGFSEAICGAAAGEEHWTDSANLFKRPLFAPRAAEDDRPVRPEEDGQHFRLSA